MLKGTSVTIPVIEQDGPLVINHVLGGSVPYHFNIRATQIRCASVPDVSEQLQSSACGRRNRGMVRHKRTAMTSVDGNHARPRADEDPVRPENGEDEQQEYLGTDGFSSGVLDVDTPWLNFPYDYLRSFDIQDKFASARKTLTRILGGSETGVNEWPWQVALLKRKNLSSRSIAFFCGGVLINEEYALTAAHCVTGFKSFNFTEVRRHIIVSVGDHDLRRLNDTKAAFRGVRDVIVHHMWDKTRNVNDIALIRLSKPVTFSGSIAPACMPTDNRTMTDEEVTITGWGVISFNRTAGPVSPVLKGVTLSPVALGPCNELWKKYDNPRTIYPEFLPIDE
ncbi:serine proteinase stubble-like, partial [Pollicipes pollicipes]|uniref:serine proteinase stubble-like n=1 Tax=Pollicipes pollicipes TaxID=41117 RepID=UPI001885771C